MPHAWVVEGPPVPTLPLLCPAAPRQPQGVPGSDTAQLHYAVVKKLRTYSGAQVSAWCQPVPVPQRYCQDVYRGQLASVHSAARNKELQKLARTYHIIIAPWIGAVTSFRAGQWQSYWEDSSPWNYANWAPTHPFHIVTTCTTLSIRGKVTQPPCPSLECWGGEDRLLGHWRNIGRAL
ncbi:C-type lectin lectoxin-Lio2-like [Serinus canaria]|uniref:C-type lectin lectoxin-Lio2-like n=1 Tax=Serinus canaria TaxID=9135 RepID=UPI0021CCA0B2|nr:C-type lectin lectoxin-Lio2-like [Serinus canaria]